jgi:hypothetical protein
LQVQIRDDEKKIETLDTVPAVLHSSIAVSTGIDIGYQHDWFVG